MSFRSFEDILLCRPEFMDPGQGGLWWCESAEDIAAWPINSVCLATLASWEDVKDCGDWIRGYPFVLVASPNRAFVDEVRQHVPWVPVLAPDPGAFGGYHSVAELARACGTADLERRLMYKADVVPSGGLLNLADVKRRDLRDIPRTLSGFPALDRALGGFRDGGTDRVDRAARRREKYRPGANPSGVREPGPQGVCLFRGAGRGQV